MGRAPPKGEASGHSKGSRGAKRRATGASGRLVEREAWRGAFSAPCRSEHLV